MYHNRKHMYHNRIAPLPGEAHVQIQNKYLQETVYRLQTQLQTSRAACRLKDKQIKVLGEQNIRIQQKLGYFSNIVKCMPTVPIACMYTNTENTASPAHIPCATPINDFKTPHQTVQASSLKIGFQVEDEWVAV